MVSRFVRTLVRLGTSGAKSLQRSGASATCGRIVVTACSIAGGGRDTAIGNKYLLQEHKNHIRSKLVNLCPCSSCPLPFVPRSLAVKLYLPSPLQPSFSAMSGLQAIKYVRGKLDVLDQLKLPHEFVYDGVSTCEEAFDCIKAMRVRGI